MRAFGVPEGKRPDRFAVERWRAIAPAAPAEALAERPTHERPCADPGLTSYRARGRYGWVMIGARDDADAMREARRSTDAPFDLQVWNGSEYVPTSPAPETPPPATQSEPPDTHSAARAHFGERVFSVRFTMQRGARRRGIEYPPLPGARALSLMQKLTARGFEPHAFTHGHGITEELDPAAMLALYGPEDGAEPAPPATQPAPELRPNQFRALAIFQTYIESAGAAGILRPTAAMLESEAARIEAAALAMDGAPQVACNMREAARYFRDAAEEERARDPERAAADALRRLPFDVHVTAARVLSGAATMRAARRDPRIRIPAGDPRLRIPRAIAPGYVLRAFGGGS
jgi:hypothetical protein